MISKQDNLKRKNIFATVLATLMLLFYTGTADAVKVLQLDMYGGTYDEDTQTIVVSGDTATVYAYLWINGDTSLLDDQYFLAVSILPSMEEDTSDPVTDYGSFFIDGMEVDVLGEMNWGYAPLEDPALWDGKDLAPHDVYPTYYYEHGFSFLDGTLDTGMIDPYNTQDRADGTLSTSFDDLLSTSGDMYYVAFDINMAGLGGDLYLHFDLYNSDMINARDPDDIDITDFAPFSHDAELRVPEPDTLLLLGLGLIGIWGWTRRYGAANIR